MRLFRSSRDGLSLLQLNPAELGAFYALCSAAEDAGLDESTVAQDLRVALIDAGLVAGAIRVTGEPPPDRVNRLAAAAAGIRGCPL